MNRPLSNALLCAILLSSAGCAELASDYTVNLVPHTLTGQAPFADGREVELVILEPDGTSSVHHAGVVQGGELKVGELPPIPADSVVGVLIEEPGGTPNQIDLDRARAWGSAAVDAGLATGEKTVTLDVLVAEIAIIGDMGTLPANRKSIGAGVAMVPGGDVFLFGGAAGTGATDAPSDRILHMTNTDLGSWTFDKLNATLTARDGVQGWFGVAASTFDDGNGPMIFVSGGRAEVGNLPGVPTRAAYLFDPVEKTITWGHKDSHDRLTVGRSEHDHVVMDNGKVVLYGGWSASLATASIEVFNPKSKSFDYLATVTHGSAAPAGASLGTGGALICGGGTLNGGGPGITSPVATCDTITLSGVVAPTNDMPLPVMGHAMAQLADGRVLATGGVTAEVTDNTSVAATGEAWMYDKGNWSQISGMMRNPRAHHAIIAMPDGNAIIIGGAANGGAVFPNPSPGVVCAELFDAKSNSFSEIKPCTAAGGGAFPGVSSVVTEGAFVLAGEDTAAASPAGDVYGYIAFTPEL